MAKIIANSDLSVLSPLLRKLRDHVALIDFNERHLKGSRNFVDFEKNIEILINSVSSGIDERHIVNNSVFNQYINLPHIINLIANYAHDIKLNIPIVDKSESSESFHLKFRDNLLELRGEIESILLYSSIYSTRDCTSKISSLDKALENLMSSQPSADIISKAINKGVERLEGISKITIEESERSKQATIEDISHETTKTKKDLSDLRIKLESDLKYTSENISSSLKEDIKKELSDTKQELEDVKELSNYYKSEFEILFVKMKDMYSISGNGKLADYNNSQAETEKETADSLRNSGINWLALPIIVTLMFISHYIFGEKLLGTVVDLNLEWIVTRFLTISISASIAVYMLKESAAHRAKENLYRQRGTQLATIDSYLADFPDENEKMKVKTNLVNNFYSFHDGKVDTSNVPDPNAQIKEVAEISKSLSKIFPIQAPESKHSQPPKPDNGSQREEQNVTSINETASEKDKTKA
ncbi:conserved hypothetical protein [Vibrio crassostreae]|uniref:hypothetical protein n=1 Tax=Vibrio crassostreae TaxID=246167 RepID=UPI0005E639AB|nr:hypothetical protein [Vibrio crassostreae]TCT63310.1 hypothetical protein EDB44_10655 [Vibrio crassostreae]TCT84209.1 hypothetical protein EDB43_106153 [Vibrio crassostreae]TCU04581.1 hypothetical protein EDB47_10755 [Vibrio crassostreae]TDW06818.1 hypothetical protein EDB45_11830 [Vibrio crassostreae]CAK1759678.1 conserved hypothetical protein [Vibrio crassostreae]